MNLLLHRYRGLSLRRLSSVRATVLANFLLDRARFSRVHGKDMSLLRSMRDSRAGVECLIVGGGPSSKHLCSEKLRQGQQAGVEVWAFNMYSDSALALQVVPDMYVLSDPAFFAPREELRAEIARVWHYVAKHGIPYIVPTGRDGHTDQPPACRFNSMSLIGWSKNIDPTRPQGYSNMVAMSSLAMALYLGFDRIFLSGFDNSMFRKVYRDRDGILRYGADTHHYPTRHLDVVGATVDGNVYADGVPAYFEAIGRIFWEYRLFQNDRIVNLDQRSLVDAFAAASDAEVDRFWSGTCEK
jgi:hypothetical protein